MARRQTSDGAVAVFVVGSVVALVLFSGPAKGQVTANLTGPERDKEPTGGDSRAAWAQSRFAAALVAVKAAWAGGEAVGDVAKDIALSLLTHWDIETGTGANEWNYNVGNITAVGSQPYVKLRDISGYVMAFRAFDSLSAGVDAYMELLKRYKSAAAALANDPVSSDWYIALGKGGWFDPTKAKKPITWDDARSLYEARRKALAKVLAS